MPEQPSLSRRRALQALTGVTLLPLASAFIDRSSVAQAMSTGGAGNGVSGGHDHDPKSGSPKIGAGRAIAYEFNGMPAPSLADPAQMATTSVASTLTRKIWPDHTQTFTLGYETFFLTGAEVPRTGGGTIVAGGYYDINNQPIIDPTSSTGRQFFSDCPDGTSLIQLSGRARGKGRSNCERIFAVVQFEYVTRNTAGASMYGLLPSPIAVLTLDQDQDTGRLELVSYSNVDTSGVHGLWITCGASISPWNTHLSSEEYEPDATLVNSQLKAFSKNLYGDENVAKPYHYGHLPEVTVHADGTGSIKKHYCLGRISHELVQVMPDERTVLMGDDATNSGLFMFVADRARDLSSGTLYVAKWTQTSSAGAGSGDLSWINLGHATSDEIKAMADTLSSADIMDVQTAEPATAGYTKINFNGVYNWIKVNPGMEKAAAFLETHRFAALRGGSMAFTKMEGTTVNAKDKKAYSAMSYIYKSMVKGQSSNQGDIALDRAINAGAVYEHCLIGGVCDTDGNKIRSSWVSVSMAAPDALVGEDLAVRDALNNSANADKIANPDNLKYSEAMRTLFIGEDSGNHVNNFLWAYNVDTGKLSRLLSCPSGAESTGLHAVDDVNGFSYIMSNFQHPGDWESPLHDVVKPSLDALEAANYNGRFSAAVGYLAITGIVH
jgi:hypothetical protein